MWLLPVWLQCVHVTEPVISINSYFALSGEEHQTFSSISKHSKSHLFRYKKAHSPACKVQVDCQNHKYRVTIWKYEYSYSKQCYQTNIPHIVCCRELWLRMLDLAPFWSQGTVRPSVFEQQFKHALQSLNLWVYKKKNLKITSLHSENK